MVELSFRLWVRRMLGVEIRFSGFGGVSEDRCVWGGLFHGLVLNASECAACGPGDSLTLIGRLSVVKCRSLHTHTNRLPSWCGVVVVLLTQIARIYKISSSSRTRHRERKSAPRPQKLRGRGSNGSGLRSGWIGIRYIYSSSVVEISRVPAQVCRKGR
jgi:hypothetical protein